MKPYIRLELLVGAASVVAAALGYLLSSAVLEFFAVLGTAVAFTLVIAKHLLA
jgi:hypothetical protein